MKRDDPPDLYAFQIVATAQSFTRAAAQLDTSQSALSHAIRRLEERLRRDGGDGDGWTKYLESGWADVDGQRHLEGEGDGCGGARRQGIG